MVSRYDVISREGIVLDPIIQKFVIEVKLRGVSIDDDNGWGRRRLHDGFAHSSSMLAPSIGDGDIWL